MKILVCFVLTMHVHIILIITGITKLAVCVVNSKFVPVHRFHIISIFEKKIITI